MAKKYADIDQPKVKKTRQKKETALKSVQDDHDDFDDPVWIDPAKQSGPDLAAEKPEHEITGAEKEFNVEVTSAKIKDIFLYAAWKNMNPLEKGSCDRDGENPVHEDLKKAFEGLNSHFARMSEQYNSDGKLDSDRMVCRGFSIGSNGEGVTLHGTRLLSNGKPFNFNTPFYKWDNDPSESLFQEDGSSLKSAINTCRAEVIQYLFKRKYQAEVVND